MNDPLDIFSKVNASTSQMIEEIKMHECLWDVYNPEYYTKESRAAAWEDICGMLGPNYADMDYRDKINFENSLKRKWKSLKDCFRRDITKLQKDPKKLGRYKYFENMKFLLKNCKDYPTLKEDDFPMKLETLEEDFMDIEMPEESKSAKRKRSSISTTPEKKKPSTTSAKRSSRIRNSKKSKRKSSPEQIHIRDYSPPDIKPMFLRAVPPINEPIPEDDEDRLFLMSLIKDLKKIPEDYKLEAKCEIMKVVRKFKMVTHTQYTIDSSFSYEPTPKRRGGKKTPVQESGGESSDSYVVEEYLDEDDEDYEIDIVKKKNIKSEKIS